MPIVISTATTIPQTVDYIQREILQGSQTEFIKSLVESTSARPDPVKAAFEWIWRNVSYYPDPTDHQMLKVVDRIVETGIANCANYCIIMGAYLYALGKQFTLRITGYDEQGTPDHIYIMYDGIALDLTAGQSYDKKTDTVSRTFPKYGFQFPNRTYTKDYAFYTHATERNINGKGRVNYYRKWLLR